MSIPSVDAYIATVDRLEPDIAPIDAAAFYASAAVSLKRIADVLEKAHNINSDHLANFVADVVKRVENMR